MTLLRQTTEEHAEEFCSNPPLNATNLQPPRPDRLRITLRRTWWLGRVPVWRSTVSVIDVPILLSRAKAAEGRM